MKTVSFTMAVLTCLAVCLPAAAQPETISVETHNLAGLWRISMPAGGSVDWRMNVSFGPMFDNFCRLEGPRDNLKAYCMLQNARKSDIGDVSVEDSRVHIAWGNMMLRVTVDGMLQPGGFTGTYTLKASGISVRAPEQMRASKILLDQDAPDLGGKGAALAKILAGIAGGAPLPSLVPSWTNPRADVITAKDLNGLGPIQTVAYLGRTPTKAELIAALPQERRAKEAPRFNDYALDIYAVEFANGERLCGMHQRADGAIDGLICN